MYKFFGQAHAAIKFAKITSYINHSKPIKIHVNGELVFEGLIWPDLRRPFPSNFPIQQIGWENMKRRKICGNKNLLN